MEQESEVIVHFHNIQCCNTDFIASALPWAVVRWIEEGLFEPLGWDEETLELYGDLYQVCAQCSFRLKLAVRGMRLAALFEEEDPDDRADASGSSSA